MATPESIEALRKTRESLKAIQKQLEPFLVELSEENNDQQDDTTTSNATTTKQQKAAKQKEKVATASMAVALAMGTLRYMGARLRGLDQGRKSDDPLRKELNQMRKLMVTVQKKLDASKEKDKEAPKRKKLEREDEAAATPSSAKKRRKS